MAELQLRDLTPAFGTEITGLDPLAALADAATTQRLRELFDTRGVLVFRDVDIDQPTQANLVRALIGMGRSPTASPARPAPNGDPFYVSNKEPERRRALRSTALPLRHDVVGAHVPGAVALRRGDRAAGLADALRERGRRVDDAARRVAGRGRTPLPRCRVTTRTSAPAPSTTRTC